MPQDRKTGPPASPLHRHIGFWMRMVSNRVSQSFAEKLEASGATVAEWVILRTLYDGDTRSPGAVAERTGLSRGAVSKLVDGLLKKRLLTRVDAASDRRYQDLKLTPAGSDLVPKLAALADKNDNEFFAVLRASEREKLLDLLKKTARLKALNDSPLN